ADLGHWAVREGAAERTHWYRAGFPRMYRGPGSPDRNGPFHLRFRYPDGGCELHQRHYRPLFDCRSTGQRGAVATSHLHNSGSLDANAPGFDQMPRRDVEIYSDWFLHGFIAGLQSNGHDVRGLRCGKTVFEAT